MTLWNDLPETREESEPWRCLRAGRREAGVVLFQSRAIRRRFGLSLGEERWVGLGCPAL